MTPPSHIADRILLATSRPAIVVLFESIAEVDTIAVAPEAVAANREAVERASVAVVDAAVDGTAAVELCRELQQRRPGLPIAALLCCPQSITPWHLRTLLAEGVSSVLDLQATPEETARALEAVAGGGSVLHLRLRRPHRDILKDVLSGRGPNETQMRLLSLVALGLTDQEIARRIHLSPHTVKHHIEQLRAEVGARNRTELAAWAGGQGFYEPEGRPSEVVPVQVTRGRGG
jgi:DNA-binding NarL/FixJ family response regulator